MDPIYFDHNATAPLHPQVLKAMLPFFGASFGNPSSVRYRLGREARSAVEEARAEVSALLGARPEEIVFTSGGSEADTLAILGSGAGGRLHERIVTSAVEHHAVLRACRRSRALGSLVIELAVDADGIVSPAALDTALAAAPTSLVSVMWANNETGVIQPVTELAALARAHGALFHTDAVQAAGKVEIDLASLPIDLLTLSAHKLGGPKGVGALFVRSGVEITPLIFGGEQEHGLRAGTENVPLIVGFGRACALARGKIAEEATRLGRLRDRLERALIVRFPEAVVHGLGAPRLPNTLSIAWPGLHSDDLLRRLDGVDICAAGGSACTTVQPDPSHVLIAMGVERDLARATLRLSLGPETTEAEIDRVVRALADIVPDLVEGTDEQ